MGQALINTNIMVSNSNETSIGSYERKFTASTIIFRHDRELNQRSEDSKAEVGSRE